MGHTGLAVLESGWWRKSNVSVRGVFDLVATMYCENPNGYHYEMANSEGAIKEAIPRIASYRECKYLCIEMHGDADGLKTLSGEKVSRTELKNLLARVVATPGSKLRGLHLGSCSFGTDKLANFLFGNGTDVGIKWVAGYSEEVDWIDSSAMDLLFLNEFLWSDATTERQKIVKTCERIKRIASGLVEELGFGVYAPSRTGIVNLLNGE